MVNNFLLDEQNLYFIDKGGKTENSRVISPESAPTHLKDQLSLLHSERSNSIEFWPF